MHAGRLGARIGRVGLRARVVILVLLAIVPLFCLLVAGAVADRDLALATARTRAVETARFGAERHDDLLQQARELLTVLRRTTEINGNEAEICRTMVKAVIADHPQFYTIGVVDAGGVIRCHSRISDDRAFVDRLLFSRAMAPDASSFVLGRFIIGPVNGKPTVAMASPLPKAADGSPRGMVFTSLNLESLQQVSAELASPRHRSVLVIDPSTSTLLARGLDDERMAGRTFAGHPLVEAMRASPQGGSIDAPGLDGLPRIFGFAPLPIAGGVMIAVGLSRQDVLADANMRLLVGLSVAMIATLAAMAAAWLVGHASQFRPVRGLVDTAQALGHGELSARAAMEPWQAPEFRVLGATLNSMAAAIAQGQKSLRESEAELRLLADNATDMIFKLDLDFRRTYVSPSSREVLGYEAHELIGKRPANMAHPDDVRTVSGSYENLVSGQERSMTMTRIQHKDGRWIWIEVHKRALLDAESGAPIGIIGSLRDVTARKEAEAAVQANEALLRGVFDHTPDSILVISVANDATFALETYNPAAAIAAGFSPGTMTGKQLLGALPGRNARKVFAELERCRQSGEVVKFEDAALFGSARRTWDATLSPIFDTGKRVARIVVTARETTEKKLAADRRKQIEDELAAANRRLKALATQDGLTGLANRRTFDEVFDREWNRAKRDQAPMGLIMLDVDRFKPFNDLYGHQAGDDALCAVARAIEGALHRPADFVARYGGEEFVIVLPGTDQAGAIEVAERVRQSVASLGVRHRRNAGGMVTISAGVWTSGGAMPANPREALKCADANLYAAKAAGRNRVVHARIEIAKAS